MNQPVMSAWKYHSAKLRSDTPIVAGAATAVLMVMMLMIGLHEQWNLLAKTVGMVLIMTAGLFALTMSVREVMRRRPRSEKVTMGPSAIMSFGMVFMASALATGVIARQPLQTGLAFRDGQNHLRAGQFELAAADFSRFVEIAPKSPSGYYWRARAAYRDGRIEAAYLDLQTAIKLQPREWNSQLLLLGTLQKLGRTAEYNERLKAIERFDPRIRTKVDGLLKELDS